MAFNAVYAGDDSRSLVRRVVQEVDLTTIPLTDWTDDELGFRLAVVYGHLDGYGHLTATEDQKTEARTLMQEIESRGYDPVSNLMLNERVQGFGWLRGFEKRQERSS